LELRYSPTWVHSNISSRLLGELFRSNSTFVDFNIAGTRVDDNRTRLFTWHWPGDDKWIRRIGTSIINTTSLSILNAVIVCLPDLSWIVCALWSCRGELNWNSGPYDCDAPPIIDNNTATSCVKSAMKLHYPMVCFIAYSGQQANGTAGAQMSMCG
jgi:hypothetical protein